MSFVFNSWRVRLLQNHARSIPGGTSSGTSFEELKRVLRSKNIYSLQRGRYYVALSLAEAESLRVVMHLTKGSKASDGKLIPSKLTEAALRIGGGTLIDNTSSFTPAQVFQGATAEQCFRFLDSQLDFEDREVSLLLRALQGSSCDKRAQFFVSVRACRRRAKIPWASSPLAKVLTTVDEFHLLASRALVARVRTALKSKRMRLLDAFRAFDGETLESLRMKRYMVVCRGSAFRSRPLKCSSSLRAWTRRTTATSVEKSSRKLSGQMTIGF